MKRIVEFRKKNKPWKSRNWEKNKQVVLGNRCEQCGSETLPFVVQHLWHPRSFSQIFRNLTGDLWKAFKVEYAEALAEDLKEERDTCPSCGSAARIRWREGAGNWLCDACKHIFSSPVKGRVLTREGRQILSRRKRENYEHRWKIFQQRYGGNFGKDAVLKAIEESRRYLSMKDTVTFCQRCAYLWDKQGLQLCAKCGANFHLHFYKVCLECSKDTKQDI